MNLGFTTAFCPVCSTAFLKKRRIKEPYAGHCNDCRFTYYFKPGEEKPTALSDKDADNRRCGLPCCEDKESKKIH